MDSDIIKCDKCIHGKVCKYKNQAVDLKGAIQKISERLVANDSIFSISCDCSLFVRNPGQLRTTASI